MLATPTLGYSCWGFLGPGVVDTPDGGRSHRPHLIGELLRHGYAVVMLQRDRDRLEAGTACDLGQQYCPGLPPLDLLFLEWRWRIPGRNTAPSCPGYTPDWHRQLELVQHYCGQVPVVIWDKDQTFRRTPYELQRLLAAGRTYLLEPSRHPARPDCTSAPFPFPPLPGDPSGPPPSRRPRDLVYVGNDYGRRGELCRWLLPAAEALEVTVAGKWPRPIAPGRISYLGRVPFPAVADLHGSAVATVLLAPPRYKRSGQYTQRIFEALQAGCAPLVPADYRDAEQVAEPELIVHRGADVADRVHWLRSLPEGSWRQLLRRQRLRLRDFSAQHLLTLLERALADDLPRLRPPQRPESRRR